MKASYILLAMILLSSLAAAQTAETSVRTLPAKADRTSENIYAFVDNAIKEKYWYYLTKACLLYLTAVDRGDDSYQFLAIYRNIVGTFLAITTWTKGSSSFQVNTLVRLGNGDGDKYGANYKPVNLEPLKVRYTLGPNEYIIEVSDCGDVKVNGHSLTEETGELKTDELLIEECKEFSKFAVEKFWYYLRDSTVVYSSVGKTKARNYCLVTYLNVVGTFFVIGSRDSSNLSVVNTFVRLGNGKASGVNYEPVKFNKINLRLTDFVEVN